MRLRLLGLSDALAAGSAPLLSAGKSLALLAFLSASPRRRADRERLLDLLWADLDRPNARSALRSALHWLKRRTGVELFESDGDTLILSPAVTSDREDFLAAIEADDLPTALSLYGGEFLPRFAAPGAREFEDWAEGERVRLRRLFVHAADRHARSLLSAGKAREAVPIAKRARDADPDTESSWRLLLEVLVAARDTVLAASEADALERYLREEEREPEPATRALLRLARQPAGSAPSDAGQAQPALLFAELVGRASEFSAVMQAWDDARAGRAAHAHVVAPGGLGKSRLLDDLAARLRASRSRVVHVRAQPGEREITYAFVAQIARDLAALPGSAGVSSASAAALVALHPALSSVWSVEPDRAAVDETLRRRGAALIELVEAVTDEAPLAILLDDLHWADASSWQVLQAVASRLGPSRVLLVTAARPTISPAAHERLRILTLEPLSAEQVGLLIESVAPLPEATWARAMPELVHQASGGSPLEVLGILQDLLDQGLLQRGEEPGWDTPDPAALARALADDELRQRRIDALDRTERWVLLLLALAGLPLRADRLHDAAGMSPDRLLASLRRLEERGLVVTRDAHATWAPSHDVIADRVEGAAAPEARRAAHQALARLFEASAAAIGSDPLLAVRHLLLSGDEASLRRHFRAFVMKRRSEGGRSSTASLTREYLGGEWSPTREHLLLGALPWRQRPLPRQLALVATAIVMFLLGAAAVAVRSVGAEAEAPYLLYSYGAETGRVLYALPRDVFEESGPLSLASIERMQTEWPDSVSPAEVDASGKALLGSINVAGPNTTELVVWSADSGTRRLSPSILDDGGGNRSPDDSLVAFVTARWSPRNHLYKVGVLNATTGDVRRLSPDDSTARDLPIGWTSDGTTYVFGRTAMRAAANSVCRIGRDRTDLDCLDTPGRATVIDGAVVDDAHVSLLMADGNEHWLARLDWRTRNLQRLTEVSKTTSISSDGQLAICLRCTADGRDQLLLIPSTDTRRDVMLPAGERWASAAFVETARGDPITGLRTVPMATPLGVGESRAITVATTTADGVDIIPARLRFRSRDTAVAVVDANGLVRGRRNGGTWVVVDAYGLATDSVRVSVASTEPTRLLSLRAPGDVARHFWAYGDPAPMTSVDAQGVLQIELPNDDPSYVSGVLSRQSFDASSGLFVEADVIVPNTMYQWQHARVSLVTVDSASWNRWNKRDTSPRVSVPLCLAETPAGEGFSNAGRGLVGTIAQTQVVDLSPGTADARHRLHVALLPDGRCGVAIDGVPVFVGPTQALSGTVVNADIALKSFETRVRVSNVSIWRGVKRALDWSALAAPRR